MDRPGFSLQKMTLRAFDLSERTARAGSRSLQRRVERWWGRLFMIIQCCVTAGLAWWVAASVLGHSQPFFAPVAAIITLGFSFGQRMTRAAEVGIGVAVGVLIGDLFVTFFGTGVWQIILVGTLAMSVATLLGARNLMIIQAGVQSIIVITLVASPGQAVSRWLDAVVGCGLALAIATIAPVAPLRRPRILTAEVLTDMSQALEGASKALRERDQEAADEVLARARNAETRLEALAEAGREGLAVVRYSPFLRSQSGSAQAYADLALPLDRVSRNFRVLARRSAVALWRGEDIPLSTLAFMESLAQTLQFMAGELYDRRLPTAARGRLVELGRASVNLKITGSLSGIVIVAQMRSMLADLLELCEVPYADALELIPDME